MKKVISFIAIIAIAAFTGNMINIGLSYGIQWKSLEPISFMESFATDFTLLLLPTATTLLPAFISTMLVFFMSQRKSLTKKYWLYALFSLLLISVFTVAYFLPLNIDFINQKITIGEVAGKLNSWLFFHWLRVAVAILAGIFALKGFESALKKE
ncbi:MAG: hypothetical protein ED556_11095 [Winogradskyella sp.]|uniref:anthrone oxygenase family protein n=1 Tax=Winogradskyella sp. TaxID=1883156 RepID=UPI000F3BBF7C|nr:anthrone oxygenase family protein [Winogradskyella sp.]RNC85104.1 MAG: hypothetical protein ED556_11095 [Winogradskyella sp.]